VDIPTVSYINADVCDAPATAEGQDIAGEELSGVTRDGDAEPGLRGRSPGEEYVEDRHYVLDEPAAIEAATGLRGTQPITCAQLGAGYQGDGIVERGGADPGKRRVVSDGLCLRSRRGHEQHRQQ